MQKTTWLWIIYVKEKEMRVLEWSAHLPQGELLYMVPGERHIGKALREHTPAPSIWDLFGLVNKRSLTGIVLHHFKKSSPGDKTR